MKQVIQRPSRLPCARSSFVTGFWILDTGPRRSSFSAVGLIIQMTYDLAANHLFRSPGLKITLKTKSPAGRTLSCLEGWRACFEKGRASLGRPPVSEWREMGRKSAGLEASASTCQFFSDKVYFKNLKFNIICHFFTLPLTRLSLFGGDFNFFSGPRLDFEAVLALKSPIEPGLAPWERSNALGEDLPP